MLTRVKVTVWYRVVISPHMGRPATLHNLTVTFPQLENKPTRTVSYKMVDWRCCVLLEDRGLSSVSILVSRCPGFAGLAGRLTLTSFSPPQLTCDSLASRHFTFESHHKHLVGGAGAGTGGLGTNLHSRLATASLPGQNSRFYIPFDRTMQGL